MKLGNDLKEVRNVTAQTVKKVMQQRLTRGTPVIVAESFGQAKLRGANMIVASKSTVKCNKGTRCAGPWCAEIAVFVTTPGSSKEEKEMGWRGGTTKICLTHLKDEEGSLLVPPPIARQRARRPEITVNASRFEMDEVKPEAPPSNGNGLLHEVTWADLAEAHSSGDINKLALLARQLKADTEKLKTKVIAAQDKLLATLTG
jgi:hypothetical protein